jgi:hypothetical protein
MIADQARMRTDQISLNVKLLTARRLGLIYERVRMINRLRARILEYFPALDRAFDYSNNRAPLTLLSSYQTPSGLRQTGFCQLAAWLKKRGCVNSAAGASKAVDRLHE